jgi:uncharacterized peroxidase-related enzyme
VTDQDAGADVADSFRAIAAKLGKVPNLYRIAANQPAVLSALLRATDALAHGTFNARTREAIALAVAGANGCDYCAAAHSAIAAGLKLDEDTIAEHLAGRATDPRTQAILQLALAVLETRGRVTQPDLAAARAAGLGDAEIVETVGNVVVNVFTNYLNNVAETDIDFPVGRARAA